MATAGENKEHRLVHWNIDSVAMQSGEFVEVRVDQGPAKRTVYLDRELLCSYSSFFYGVIDEGLPARNDNDRIIHLSAVGKNVFASFVLWLYTGTFPRPCRDRCDSECIRPFDLVELWFFGFNYGIPALQNAAMDDLIKWIGHHDQLITFVVPEVYKKKTEQPATPLRKLVVNMVAFCYGGITSHLMVDNYLYGSPEEFKSDVRALRNQFNMIAFTTTTMTPRQFSQVSQADKCTYHVH